MLESLDHIVYCVHDLPGAVSQVERLLGAPPVPGGSHEGLGSQNYLLSLGPRCYLEIVGPDPAQDWEGDRLWLGGVSRSLPTVTTWSFRNPDLVRLSEAFPDLLGEARSMERSKPDGSHFSWTLTMPLPSLPHEGIVPFLIDWGDGLHPASGLEDHGLRVSTVTPVHPDPVAAEKALASLGITCPVREGDPRLLVRITRPDGVEVEVG